MEPLDIPLRLALVARSRGRRLLLSAAVSWIFGRGFTFVPPAPCVSGSLLSSSALFVFALCRHSLVRACFCSYAVFVANREVEVARP
jgi:hypothetical protein